MERDKMKIRKKDDIIYKGSLFAIVLFLFIALTGGISAMAAEEDDDIPVAIYAVYTGVTVTVGNAYDETKLSVTATYKDGTTETITDYFVSGKEVVKEGSNIFTVIYKGRTSTFTVNGRKPLSLYATYTGQPVSIGNAVDPRNLMVYVMYSDGSQEQIKDFLMYNSEITQTGTNTAYVTYNNLRVDFNVTGTAQKTVASIYAAYTGKGAVIGKAPNVRDLLVTAVFADGMTETAMTYKLEPEVIQVMGPNLVTVYYQGQKTTVIINGIEKSVSSITAVYKGDPVSVGSAIRKSDVEVTATLIDGTKEKVTNFSLLPSSITYAGSQIITVSYEGKNADIVVTGVQGQSANFTNSSKFDISNGSSTGNVQIAMPKNVEASRITGDSLNEKSIDNLVRRVVKKSENIAFVITLKDDDIGDEMPLIARVTLPSGFKIENCAIYYTPNKKSVLGKINTEIVETNNLQFTLYHEGVYVLVHDISAKKE